MTRLKSCIATFLHCFFIGSLYIISQLPKKLRPSWLFCGFIFIVFSFLTFWVCLSFYAPPPYEMLPGPVKVMVHKGTSIGQIGSILVEKGVISSGADFVLVARIMKLDRKIKAGRYVFEYRLPAIPAVKSLVYGGETSVNITIPEGFNIYEIARVLEDSLEINSQEFINVATDSLFVASLGIPGKTAEGFLFPNTYNLIPDMNPQKIIELMFKTLKMALPEHYEARAESLGLTVLELFTLASIVEKEGKHKEELPIIASVYLNRLKLGMKLQADPTVLYGLKVFNRAPTYADLEKDTPYNTYKYKGLPPGPICNPGLSAIMATLYPASTNYLYFVRREGGWHTFSTSVEEHTKNVINYRKREYRLPQRK